MQRGLVLDVPLGASLAGNASRAAPAGELPAFPRSPPNSPSKWCPRKEYFSTCVGPNDLCVSLALALAFLPYLSVVHGLSEFALVVRASHDERATIRHCLDLGPTEKKTERDKVLLAASTVWTNKLLSSQSCLGVSQVCVRERERVWWFKPRRRCERCEGAKHVIVKGPGCTLHAARCTLLNGTLVICAVGPTLVSHIHFGFLVALNNRPNNVSHCFSFSFPIP